MKERPTNGQVIIVFTEHPILGILLIPYIAEKLDDGTLQLVEQAFHASPEAMSKMSEAERQAIHIASLLVKPEKLKVNLNIEYVAMEIPNDFIVGYGLDYDGFGRNYPDIYTVVD